MSITPYLQNYLHWLPIGPRVDFKVLLLTKKAILNSKPSYLSDYLKPANRRKGLFSRPKIEGRHSFAWRAFKYSAPALINKIPQAIRQIESVDEFKKRLKSFLFTDGFNYKLDSILNYSPSELYIP